MEIFFPFHQLNQWIPHLLPYNFPQGKPNSPPVPPALHRWAWYTLKNQVRTFPLRKMTAALHPSWSQWDEDVLAALTEKDCWWLSHPHKMKKKTKVHTGRLQKILQETTKHMQDVNRTIDWQEKQRAVQTWPSLGAASRAGGATPRARYWAELPLSSGTGQGPGVWDSFQHLRLPLAGSLRAAPTQLPTRDSRARACLDGYICPLWVTQIISVLTDRSSMWAGFLFRLVGRLYLSQQGGLTDNITD